MQNIERTRWAEWVVKDLSVDEVDGIVEGSPFAGLALCEHLRLGLRPNVPSLADWYDGLVQHTSWKL